MKYFNVWANTPNLLNLISNKKIWKLGRLPKFCTKMKISQYYNSSLGYNYINYPFLVNKIFKFIFWAGTVIGIGHTNYYSLDYSKKTKNSKNFKYFSKLNLKKESRFFYGICISKKNWKINSTIKLRNVYYNEIVEKTFLLFNPWNSVSLTLNCAELLNAKKYSGVSNWKKWFYLRSKPRQFSKIITK